MKHLWLLLLPLFCLPDLLLSQQTTLGIFKWSDYLIWPYLLSLAWAGAFQRGAVTRPLTTALAVFVVWTLVSTLTIPLRYGYASDYFTRFGLAKLAKFVLYAAAGIATIRVVSGSPEAQARLRWSILVALLVSGVSMYVNATWVRDLPQTPDEATFDYQATNAVSVQMSMLLAFVLGEWADRTRQIAWRNVGVLILPAVVAGFFLTGGRAGWIGLLFALAYVLARAGLRPSFVLGGLVLVAGASVLYTQNESFSHHVDITINPELLDVETEFAQATGFDDGNRVNIFLRESQRLVIAPLFGSGLFHRGAASGLYTTGSHNFFLQMFLETGVVGGAAMIALFWRMWVASRGIPGVTRRQLGTQAALLAAVAGGFSGEYFYGGTVLLMLLLLVAPAFAQAPAPVPEPAPLTVRPSTPPRLRVQGHA